MALNEEYSTTVLVFTGVFTVTYFLVWLQKPKQQQQRCPPSLPCLPVVGSIPFLPHYTKMHHFLTEQAKKLGKVFALKVGNRYTVVLNGREAINEAFVKRSVDFASRPAHFPLSLCNPNFDGLIWHVYNAKFKHFHQLSLAILKKFGFGKGIMEERIRVEVEDLINELEKHKGVAFDPSEVITSCVFNVISSIIFGERFQHSDPQLKTNIDSIHHTLRMTGISMNVALLPILRFVPKYKRCLKAALSEANKQLAILNERIKKSLSGETEESFISCFVEAEGPGYDHQQLLHTLRDFFIAGTDTTSTSLLWMLELLANYPEVQRRLQIEIDSVVPSSRLPSLEDKSNLPYVEAATLELMRIRTIVPLAIHHKTTCNTEVGGYFIPAESLVIANLYGTHMDPMVWPEPEIFRPERFLDESGLVINKDLVIPFSLGKRSCLGEMLARQELFLFLTGLLQHFDVRPPDGQDRIECHELVGIVTAPSPFQVRLLKRTLT